MGQTMRGRPRSAVCFGFSLLAAWGAVACGSSDGGSSGAVTPKMGAAMNGCGTEQEPTVITLSNVMPAVGSSVPNSAIVQTLTLVGRHSAIDLTLAEPMPQHTAGQPTPSPVRWTVGASGADTVYTSEPIVWATAPGHVELEPPPNVVLVDQTTGCVSILPTPVFSYDITAP